MMKDIYIVGGLRLPIGGVSQSLKEISAIDLGAIVIKGVLDRVNIDNSLVDEVIMGNVVGAGLGQNPARQAAVRAKLPLSVGAFTINKVCGSGLKSVILGVQAISCGDSDLIIAGGMESASQCPCYFPRNKKFSSLTEDDVIDSLSHDGLLCGLENKSMGEIAEYTAKKFNISRYDQDQYSYNSHRKAIKAIDENLFQKETIPVNLNGQCLLSVDEKPRKNISLEKLSNLPSAFCSEGTVTAGNSSAPADGSAALILSSKEGLKKTKAKPIAKILGYATATTDPKLVFTTSSQAIENCLKATSLRTSDIDVFEINEAFAAQALLTLRQSKLDEQKVNIFGGTVALGHPLGVSGARGLVTLLNVLRTHKKKIGITSVCLGGGSAVSMAVEII